MVGEPIVFKGRGEPREYPLGIDEVNLVIFEIRAALRIIPSEPHIRIVYTTGANVKTESESPLTIRLSGAWSPRHRATALYQHVTPSMA